MQTEVHAKDNLEKDNTYWKHVFWSDETKLELFDHGDSSYKKEGTGTQSIEYCSPSKTWWWEYYAIWEVEGMTLVVLEFCGKKNSLQSKLRIFLKAVLKIERPKS